MIIQYSFSTEKASIYSPGVLSKEYTGVLLDSVVALLSALVPSGQAADMFEIDPAGDMPSAWSGEEQTDADGNVITVQVPTAWRKHVTGIIATDLGTIQFDSETCSSELQAALLALWADIAQLS